MPTDGQYRAALETLLHDTDITIGEDSSSIIRSGDEGAYVRVDFWISNEDAEAADAD